MNLPFTHDQFLDLFGAYNQALWPVAGLLWLLTLGAALYLGRKRARPDRVILTLLSLHWAWAGVAYHYAFFRRINPAATAFAILFVAEAALLAWRAVARSEPMASSTDSAWSRAGWILVAYALLYPWVGILTGLRYPRLPSFGVPCPTTILTAGFLLLLPGGFARALGVIPVLWAAIGGSAAFVLGIRADLALPVAGGLLLIRLLLPASPGRG